MRKLSVGLTIGFGATSTILTIIILLILKRKRRNKWKPNSINDTDNYETNNYETNNDTTNNYETVNNNTTTIPLSKDSFGYALVANKTQLIELKSIYGISQMRDIVQTQGSGTVTNTGSEYLLHCQSANDLAVLSSAERGRYVPGYSAEVGVGVRIPLLPTGTQSARWGLWDANDGLYFGVDGTGIFVAVMKDGVVSSTYQNDWNGNKMSDLNLADGNIYQIRFSWYGYGVIEFMIIAQDGSGPVILHSIKVKGKTSLKNPNLPIEVESRNGTTATPFDVYVAGRQYSILGNYVPNLRINSETRINVPITTTVTSIISIKKKAAYVHGSVKLEGIDILTTVDSILEIRVNGSTTGTFTTPSNTTDSETACVVNTNTSTITGGIVIWKGLTAASTNQNRNIGTKQGLYLDFIEEQQMNVCVYTTSGTGTCTIVVRWREEW
jgi:hypothetical protein